MSNGFGRDVFTRKYNKGVIGAKVTQNISQYPDYPLHHVPCTPAKFKSCNINNLEGVAFAREYRGGGDSGFLERG